MKKLLFISLAFIVVCLVGYVPRIAHRTNATLQDTSYRFISALKIPVYADTIAANTGIAALGTDTTGNIIMTDTTIWGRYQNKWYKSGSGTSSTSTTLSYFTIDAYCNFLTTTFTPVVSTTYYFGELSGANASTSIDLYATKVPTNCTLVGYDITYKQNSVTPSSEASTLYARLGSTDVLLTNSLVFTTSQTKTYIDAFNLNTDVAANTTVQIKWLTPAWTTAPAQVMIKVKLYFKPR